MANKIVICKDTASCTAAAAKMYADLQAARKGARWSGDPLVEELDETTGDVLNAWSFEESKIILGK